MQKQFQKALFIFRRDLRLEDNTGLIYALEHAKEVILAFIFTPQQIEHNAYKSERCLQFMIESLEALESELGPKGKLYLFYGHEEAIVAKCIEELNIDGVVVNRDYTPYSIERDRKIATTCTNLGISFHSFDDALLHTPEQSVKANGLPYVVFTPYYRHVSHLEVSLPISNHYDNYYTGAIAFAHEGDLYKKILPKRSTQAPGGRIAALEILKAIDRFSCYDSYRDFPAKHSTTHLSSHLKFTTCSAREVYWTIKKGMSHAAPLLRALYWRDFFSTIAFYFPAVFKGAFHAKFNRIQWSGTKALFKKWCEGKTGFPIVDAGMREMNQTGFMHNRVRMIVASFLVKDLHIDWRWGEKYFAQHLIDYDPAVNNGNWQWCASTGCDAQPYFRIFNPWLQSAKFDPDGIYIKRWVPELVNLPAAIIHTWHLEKHHPTCPAYPAPIVEHAKAAEKALALYRHCTDI